VNLFFIMSKAKTNKHINLTTTEWNQKVVLPVSVGGGILSALITYFFICPHLRKRVEIEHALVEEELKAEAEAEEVGYAKGEEEAEYDEDGKIDKGEAMAEGPLDEKKNGEDTIRDDPDKVDKEDDLKKSKHVILRGLDWVAENTIRQDLKAQSLAENHRAAHLWDTSAEYDGKVEHLFSFLQVFTACLASFAHGSNDVANAIAPMSAVIDIYNTGVFNSKAPVQRWLLAIGGVGIALGFAIFGYRIIKAVGYKLIVISPSRGFCIELAASLSVSLASFLSIPVSTTQ
jgi:phosphate/sulfate permease